MTIKSQPLDFAVSIIAVAGYASGTCKSSAEIPIWSAIARTSSSTLPACSLQAASKLSISSCVGIHPEACPLVDRLRFRYGDDCHFSVQGLCQSDPVLNPSFRDIRSIRAQENIGVHWGLPIIWTGPRSFAKSLTLRYRPLKVFANEEGAERWFAEHDPEGMAFEYPVAGGLSQ
jgi:hypothetical protein